MTATSIKTSGYRLVGRVADSPGSAATERPLATTEMMQGDMTYGIGGEQWHIPWGEKNADGAPMGGRSCGGMGARKMRRSCIKIF